jgi:hypothetical protein
MQCIDAIGEKNAECVKFFKGVTVCQFEEVRREALTWLLKWAEDKEERRKELVPVVKAGLKDHPTSVPFIEAAGKLGPAAKDLLPTLKPLKLSKNATVRGAADRAVAAIEAP